jgi:hypothetical protein
MAMTLNATVLQKLADWHPPRDRRQTVALTDELSGWSVSITADRHDDLSTLVWEMSVQRLNPSAQRGLEGWANRVVSRATGLLELLRIVEIDVQRNEALLRSSEPTRRGQDLFYYEILLKGDREGIVRRYRGSQDGERRQQVCFTLTHEALAKLAADLASD